MTQRRRMGWYALRSWMWTWTLQTSAKTKENQKGKSKGKKGNHKGGSKGGKEVAYGIQLHGVWALEQRRPQMAVHQVSDKQMGKLLPHHPAKANPSTVGRITFQSGASPISPISLASSHVRMVSFCELDGDRQLSQVIQDQEWIILG